MHLRRNPIGLFACAVFVLVSLVGQGLHFLPRANHDVAQSHACGHCHHHGATLATDSEMTSLDDECPICRFLAQLQIQTDLRMELPLTNSCTLLNDRQPLRMALPLVSLHLARAPPLASGSSNG